MKRINFNLEFTASHSKARAATIKYRRGEIKTPVFMPVGTHATVRGVKTSELNKMGAQVLLANTYHLLLRPGPDIFRKVGGIHKFMNWQGGILTDSGGFQIFAMPGERTMSEDGATFTSYIDGKKVLLSPEVSIATQIAIDSDIMMVLDQCVPSTSDFQTTLKAMDLTHRWAERSLVARDKAPGALFGIVQGAMHPSLRQQSAQCLTSMDFDGFAIGGLAVGETKNQREDFTALCADMLPQNKPRYLMGVGTPIDLLEAIHRGVDMFDCILPAAWAQQGQVFTSSGQIRITRGVYKDQDIPLDPLCSCETCNLYSRAYLHQLLKTGEPLGKQLLTEHNLRFYMNLMQEIRQNILNDSFASYYHTKRLELVQVDEEFPRIPSKQRVRKKDRQTKLGNYEVTKSPIGHYSIKQRRSGEIMHSINNPDEEAATLYVDQSRFCHMVQQQSKDPLVIWDVGLGAGHNAMACIHSYEKLRKPDRPVHIISFEIDLDAFRLTTRKPELFPHMRHRAPKKLLKEGYWNNKDLHWHLKKADFIEAFPSTIRPHIVFFDPFSQKTDESMWTGQLFSNLYKYLSTNEVKMYTYSASNAVRSKLLAAGFFVSMGVATGPKTSTTVAHTRLDQEDNSALLGHNWIQTWQRSHLQYPHDAGLGKEAFIAKVTNHPQFHPPILMKN